MNLQSLYYNNFTPTSGYNLSSFEKRQYLWILLQYYLPMPYFAECAYKFSNPVLSIFVAKAQYQVITSLQVHNDQLIMAWTYAYSRHLKMEIKTTFHSII